VSHLPEKSDASNDLRPVDASHAAARGLRREHLARVMMANLPLLQAAARRKLTNRTRAVHDSHDVASSVLRRIDLLASEGRLDGFSDDEVLHFALTIAANQAVSRTRAMERLAAQTDEDGTYAQLLRQRLDACGDDERATMLLYRIALSIADAPARELFLLRFKGLTFTIIAQVLEIKPDAARQRWTALRRTLESQLAEGVFDEKI
jgi:DNA-directed RNA polymerase specialized sigma24 family protein